MRNIRRGNECLFENGDTITSSGGDVHHLHIAEAVEAVGAAALQDEFGHRVRGMRKGDHPNYMIYRLHFFKEERGSLRGVRRYT